jgi:hypothetical protein
LPFLKNGQGTIAFCCSDMLKGHNRSNCCYGLLLSRHPP